MSTPVPPNLGITINPNTPPGTEPLKLGPPRFHEIKQALLSLLNLPAVTTETFKAPFWFDEPNGDLQSGGLLSVLADPDAPLGIATKQYADSKAVVLELVGGPDAYAVGNVDATFAWNPATIYILVNTTGTDNTTGVAIQAGTQVAIGVRHLDGLVLVAGDFLGNADYVATYDAAQQTLVLAGFVGGTLTQLLTLAAAQDTALATPATPNQARLATTKQYVDSAVGHPVITLMPAGTVNFDTTPADLWTADITTPNDGNSYLLRCDYNVNVVRHGGQTQVFAWLHESVGSLDFGAAGGVTAGFPDVAGLATSAMSPTVYGPNVTVTITVRGQTTGNDADAEASVSAGIASSLTLMLMRTTA